MFLRIETIAEKKLVGMRVRRTLSNGKVLQLWQNFMSRRKEIGNAISNDLISVQVYDKGLDQKDFGPDTEFETWASTEVTDHQAIPDGMEALTLSGGMYAVFLHRGPLETTERTFRYIFGTWLPDSYFTIDNRPQFEILGTKYKHGSPDSEEEIWIPVRVK